MTAAVKKIPKAPSVLEETLALQLRFLKLDSGLVREHRFHPTRRWRFDFAWPELKLAVEAEGFEADLVKYGEAMVLGWNVYRVSGGLIKSGAAMDTIKILHKLATKARG